VNVHVGALELSEERGRGAGFAAGLQFLQFLDGLLTRQNPRRPKENYRVLDTGSPQSGHGVEVFGNNPQRPRISAFQEAHIVVGKSRNLDFGLVIFCHNCITFAESALENSRVWEISGAKSMAGKSKYRLT
jgi:hypothetical protein